jgi:hypothetical protein
VLPGFDAEELRLEGRAGNADRGEARERRRQRLGAGVA